MSGVYAVGLVGGRTDRLPGLRHLREVIAIGISHRLSYHTFCGQEGELERRGIELSEALPFDP